MIVAGLGAPRGKRSIENPLTLFGGRSFALISGATGSSYSRSSRLVGSKLRPRLKVFRRKIGFFINLLDT